jgi:hypothetical protein
MDLYTSIALVIALVVVAIIILLVGSGPPRATVGLKDGSDNAAQQPTLLGGQYSQQIRLADQNAGSIHDHIPSGGLFHGRLSKSS